MAESRSSCDVVEALAGVPSARDHATGPRSEVLEDINEDDMWVGLGISTSRLVMCHPIWLQRAISLYSA